MTERLGRALSGAYVGERHLVSLALAGALLVDRDLKPEMVPAVVDAASRAAGWEPEHHRRNACDTVGRWVRGFAVRRDLPPAVWAALEPDKPTEESITDLTRKLELAIGQARDGCTLVRAGCGLGKTRCAEQAAITRANRTGEHKHNTCTVISVPTNELAQQVTEHIRTQGTPVLRLFGPASVPGPHDGWECRFRPQASELANSKLSIRWELCEGRKKDQCPYRSECKAVEGQDGPPDARIIVANHGLLHELGDRAGLTGLLVIDEPPNVLEDTTLTLDNLELTMKLRGQFDERYCDCMSVALDCVIRWLPGAKLAEACSLRDVLPAPDTNLLDRAFDSSGATTVVEAAELALYENQRTPPISHYKVTMARSNFTFARELATTMRVFSSIHRAITDPSVRVAVYCTQPTQNKPSQRYLAVTSVRSDLAECIRRDGRTVLMSADVQLYAQHITRVLGYAPPMLELRAPDGVAVRRIILRARKANRTEWLVRNRKPTNQLKQALSLATGRVVVVTFLAMVEWVREQAPDVSVGHYGALRGLDTWKDFDTCITLGDPLPNLDFVARTVPDDGDVSDRARDLGRSELEQAHGRLRTVHRTTPCTSIHVGSLLPDGWQGRAVENIELRGRPKRQPNEQVDIRALVKQAGGIRASARVCRVAPSLVFRWVKGTGVPTDEAVAALVRARNGAGLA